MAYKVESNGFYQECRLNNGFMVKLLSRAGLLEVHLPRELAFQVVQDDFLEVLAGKIVGLPGCQELERIEHLGHLLFSAAKLGPIDQMEAMSQIAALLDSEESD